MRAFSGQHGLVVLPVVALVTGLAIGAAFFVNRMVARDILIGEAEALARTLAGHTIARQDPAGTRQPAPGGEGAVYILLSPQGTVIDHSPHLTIDRLDTLLAEPFHRPLVEQAFAAGSLRHHVPDDLLDPELRVVVYAPVPQYDKPAVIRVDVRPSDTRAVVLSALDRVSAFTALLVLVAGGLVLYVLWGRHRDSRSADRVRYLSQHDALTDIANRAAFVSLLDQARRGLSPAGGEMAVLAIDVDRFRDVNETFGHAAGDLLLRTVSGRISEVVGPDHPIGRLSGDEFAVLVDHVDDRAAVEAMAARIVAACAEPVEAGEIRIGITASLGIAFASDRSEASRLLHNAGLALEHAKAAGGRVCRTFAPEMGAEYRRRRDLEEGLRLALEHERLKLLYQPQIDLASGRVSGYEALVRWESPEEGLVSPAEFIPLAEETGLIMQIGEWVLRRACRDAAGWPDHITVAVNLSPAQFRNGAARDQVMRALRGSRLDPRRLEIEVTESLLISDTELVLETLEAIQSRGVRIALDDFGSGYSSLSYLSRFPFDKLKIDRSFIDKLGRDRQAEAIVSTIVGLARVLDMQVTAEGVERDEQATMLRAIGCHQVQGFLYGTPQHYHDTGSAPGLAASPDETVSDYARR